MFANIWYLRTVKGDPGVLRYSDLEVEGASSVSVESETEELTGFPHFTKVRFRPESIQAFGVIVLDCFTQHSPFLI